MKKTWIPLIVLVLLAMAAALYFATSRPGTRGSDLGHSDATLSDTGESVSIKPFARAKERPLPPTDLPLSAVIDDLKRRANRGEANAACRLATEWTECLGLQKQLQRNETILQNRERIALRLLPEGNSGNSQRKNISVDAIERGVDYAVAEVERSKSALVHCEGVPSPQPEEVTRYWRQAALAGHLPSMRNYAVGNAFRRDEILNNLPALMIYRQEAEKIARQAADQGDLRAAIALAGAYSPLTARRGSFLSQIVEPNAAESLVLSYRIHAAMEGLQDPLMRSARSELAGMINGLETMLSPQDARIAKDRAEKSRPLAVEAQDFRGLYTLEGGFVPDASKEECDTATLRKDP